MSDDLLGAMATRTQRVALPRAEHYADSNRLYLVQITRPAVEPTFDRESGAMVRTAQEPVYSGKARIWAVNPGQVVDLGAGPIYYGNVRVSIPSEEYIPPRNDDIVTVVDDGLGFAQRMGMTDRQFRVIGVTTGGQLTTGWLLDCAGIQPQRALDD